MNNSFKVGNSAEIRFIKYLKDGFNIDAVKTSKNDDIIKHQDYKLINFFPEITKKSDFFVDIKSLKKIQRNDLSYQDEYTWIELKNVNGDDGWVKSKYLDGIVIETFKHWVVLDRLTLENYVESVLDDDFVYNPNDAHYKKYSRNGRLDISTLVDTKTIIDYCGILIFSKTNFFILDKSQLLF